jgi:tRNA U38,U39,U40 pseudouridine synthase TruA
MVYLQVQAGQNRLELEGLERAVLEAQPQTPGLAPSCGLVLWKVCYVDWQGNEKNQG